MWCHQWPSRHHHQHPLVLVPPPFFLSLSPTPLSFPLPLLLVVVVVRWMERQVRASPTTHHHCALWLVPRFSAVCAVCCVVAWWAWLVVVLVATPRLFRCHQCLCFQSFTTHPPRFTTQSQSLSSSCPCAHSFCHSLTHSQATPPRHTHTHAWWLVHFGAWCVCVCPRCWLWPRLARHSHVHPLLVPHTTPLLLLLLLLVLLLVDVVVAAWVLWREWPLGPLTGCAGAVHSRFTHTHTG